MNSDELRTSRRALFFDRDGVVNRRRVDDYVKRWEEFELLDGVADVLRQARAAGFVAILVTNQRGIARGLMTEEDLAAIHEGMQRELAGAGGFDAIYYCPHERDAGCSCRKPLPGMLFEAASEHDLDLASSWMIGDSESDVAAGRAAGCRTVLIAPAGTDSAATAVVTTIDEAWREIEERE